MMLNKSIDFIDTQINEVKSQLYKTNEKARKSTTHVRFEDRFSFVLPNHILAFIHRLVASISPKNSLDPWGGVFSPSTLFKIPGTEIICFNKEHHELIKSFCNGLDVKVTNGDGTILLENIDKTYDLISSLVPFSLKLDTSFRDLNPEDHQRYRGDASDFLIAKSCDLLNENGTGIFLVSNQFFMTNNSVESELNQSGCYIDTIFGLPNKTFTNTAIESNIIVVKRGTPKSYRYFELGNDIDYLEAIAKDFTDNQDSENRKKIQLGDYRGVSKQRAKEQIERLETQYKNYKTYTLQEIAEIKAAKSDEDLNEHQNTLSISRFGRCAADGPIEGTKYTNTFSVVLDKNIVLSEYLEIFFRSTLGRMILYASKSAGTIEVINKHALMEMEVPIPSLQTQQDIIHADQKVHKIYEVLSDFSSQLAINPLASNKMSKQLDEMSKAVGKLTEEDHIRGLIRSGESKTLEFKETLSWDVRKKEKNPAMELMCLKTIAAFLNSDGGTLIIGVADDGSIPGINFELEKLHKGNPDKLQTHFKNLLKARIGEQYYTFFNVKFSMVGDITVVVVECRPSDLPCYLKGADKTEDFYVRAPAATDKLDTRKAVEYIQSHWK